MSGLLQIGSAGSRSVGFGSLVRVALNARAWLAQCSARAAERRVLARLTDWQLSDVGISRAEADAEAGKWSWRP
jgi:uncharacterized protein YjiS (DUF1127 family)